MIKQKPANLEQLVEPDRVHRLCYTDQEIFDLEMKNIFEKTWVYAGHESQVPKPGDYWTFDIGRQVSLYAFNDWALAFAGTVTDFFSTRSRAAPPPGLSEAAIAALKTLRLGERVTLSGRMGEIAGSGVLDLSRLFGKSAAEHRQFLQTPRFVARIEALQASKK